MRGLSRSHFAMSFREISTETGLPVREVRRLYYSAVRKMCRYTHRTIVAEIVANSGSDHRKDSDDTQDETKAR